MQTKITAISDTHGSHHGVTIQECDVLIHAGDCSSNGSKEAVRDFIKWFAAQPTKEKILIAGNHDWLFEKDPRDARRLLRLYGKGITYLEDDWARFYGIVFYGSPVQPTFLNWAFNRDRGAPIKKHWDRIQRNTDVIITHGPAYGVLDACDGRRNEHLGCEDLLNAIKRIKPKFHIFGHIHSGYGIKVEDGTTFVNASLLDEDYSITNKPVEITL